MGPVGRGVGGSRHLVELELMRVQLRARVHQLRHQRLRAPVLRRVRKQRPPASTTSTRGARHRRRRGVCGGARSAAVSQLSQQVDVEVRAAAHTAQVVCQRRTAATATTPPVEPTTSATHAAAAAASSRRLLVWRVAKPQQHTQLRQLAPIRHRLGRLLAHRGARGTQCLL